MKRKLIIALAAAMTITLGSVGVVSADDANFAPFIPVNETGIRDGFIWVVDKEAWDEQVLVSPEEGHWETVIDKEAWIEKIEHKEEGHYENGKLISPEKGHYETIVDKEAWKAFQKTGKPIVLIDRKIQGVVCDSVLVDNEQAASDALKLLYEKGHRNIGIIGGPEEISTAQERMKGYCKTMEELNLPVRESLIVHGDYTIQGGVKAMETLVQKNPDMTAVFITNYEMTMGAVIGLNELGIRIPEEISLVGFDNLPFARACNPKLTIVSQPTEKIAEATAGIMLERLEHAGNESGCRTEKLGTHYPWKIHCTALRIQNHGKAEHYKIMRKKR